MTDNQAIFTTFVCCSGPLILPGILMIFRVHGVANLVYAIASILSLLGTATKGSKPQNLVNLDDETTPKDDERIVGAFLVVLGIIFLFVFPEMFKNGG